MKEHKIEGITVTEKNIGDLVTYVPRHVNGDANHKDAEKGNISSINDHFVFVKFKYASGQACRPDDLVWG